MNGMDHNTALDSYLTATGLIEALIKPDRDAFVSLMPECDDETYMTILFLASIAAHLYKQHVDDPLDMIEGLRRGVIAGNLLREPGGTEG